MAAARRSGPLRSLRTARRVLHAAPARTLASTWRLLVEVASHDTGIVHVEGTRGEHLGQVVVADGDVCCVIIKNDGLRLLTLLERRRPSSMHHSKDALRLARHEGLPLAETLLMIEPSALDDVTQCLLEQAKRRTAVLASELRRGARLRFEPVGLRARILIRFPPRMIYEEILEEVAAVKDEAAWFERAREIFQGGLLLRRDEDGYAVLRAELPDGDTLPHIDMIASAVGSLVLAPAARASPTPLAMVIRAEIGAGVALARGDDVAWLVASPADDDELLERAAALLG